MSGVVTQEMRTAHGLSEAAARTQLNIVLAAIRTVLWAGASVRLDGIGTLKVVTIRARDTRNPKTGQPVHVPQMRVIKMSKGGRVI